MSTRRAELLMAIGMLLFSLSLMWSVWADGLHIGWVEERGPGAGAWPFWLSFGMALTCLWTLVRWYKGTTPESRNTGSYIDTESFGLVMISFAALTVMIFLVNIVGTYIAVFLFLGFYMRFLGNHRWSTTLVMCFGAVFFIYFLFEWQLTKYLPKGWPIFEEGFLWIDNFRWEYLM
ncbi:MAG: tripartite tricarboxylate transporter TctB family protein [Pseudomonadota bacterium]